MEEILYKIDSNNAMISSEAIHLLIKYIIKIIDENKNKSTLEEAYQFLMEKCGCDNTLVSSTACRGLLNLVKFGYITPDSALELSTSIVLTAKNYAGIMSVISNILEIIVLNEVQEKTTFTSKWNTGLQTHPFIVVIKLHPSAIHDVYNEIEYLCSRDSAVYEHCIELLRPVFVWIMCHPSDSYSQLNYRNLFQIVLNLNDLPDQMSLILDCIGWQQLTPTKCWHTFEACSALVDWAFIQKSHQLLIALLPLLANVVHSMTIYCKNPKPCYALIKKIILYIQSHKFRTEEVDAVINCTTCMLSDTLRQCPVAHLADLVDICKELCNTLNCPISTSLLIAALLQWDYNKNILTIDFNEEIRKMIDTLCKFDDKLYGMKTTTIQNTILDYFKSINRRIYVGLELSKYYKTIITDKLEYLKWKDHWDTSTNKHLKCEHILYLQGLLILNDNIPNVHYDKIDILYKLTEIVSSREDLMFGQLPITLFFLRSSKNPNETIAILKNIPVLANLRENVPVVLGIITCLEMNPHANLTHFIKGNIRAFIIKLYMKLIEKQRRCYSYLYKALVKSMAENISKSWELLTAQASAFKQISEGREVNPNELAPLMSELIKQSTSEDAATACCICLDAFGILWKREIIDPETLWQILAPKFHNEYRIPVKISISKLLGIIPDVYKETPSEHDDFIDRVICTLWKNTENRHDDGICIAGFTALSNFKLENMTLKQIPDVYKTGIKLPPNKITMEANVKPEDVLNYIPSIVWGNMFKYVNVKLLPGVNVLCHALMEREIFSYRIGIYNSNVAEPDTAKYLPTASVVGGVMEYLRKELVLGDFKENLSENIYECLKCLSTPFSKPLPPLNWSFLYELLKDESLKDDVKMSILRLLTHQADSSPSAMKMLIDCLDSQQQTVKEMQFFFEILPDLCKSVKPKKLLPIVQEMIDSAYFMMQSNVNELNDSGIFLFSLKYLMQCFNDVQIDENIKIPLGNTVIKYWDNINCESDVWPTYAKVCCELPEDVMQRIIFPINKKSCSLRCMLALRNDSENNLDWLNEIINTATESDRDDQILYLTMMSNVLAKIDVNRNTRMWIPKLLTKLQIDMFNAKTSTSVEFICDIVVTFAIMLSKQEIFNHDNDKLMSNTTEKLEIFPQILNSFFQDLNRAELTGIGYEILDWLVCNKINEFIPKDIERAFNLAMICCRHSKPPVLWPKYVSAQSKLLFTDIS